MKGNGLQCQVVNPQNLTSLRVDELSDDQIRSFMRQVEASGLTQAQLEQYASQRGMSPSEIKKLRERVEKLSGANLKRFFLKGQGAHQDFVKIRPELRAMITFRQSNLLAAEWQVSGPFDAIFCRNVMIYFDKPTQHQILERFVPLLRPHGLLFAGHSENFHHASRLFSACGKTVYRIADSAEKCEASDG